jgi:hypothetical protein
VGLFIRKERNMKRGLWIVLCAFTTSYATGQQIVVSKIKGDVAVRHGVAESWTTVSVGDVLKPEDSMRTGRGAEATLVVDAARRMVLPSEVMVDASDLRHLTPEELMLKLTMERVRSSSYEWKTKELNIPNASVVHGADKSKSGSLADNDLWTGTLQLNGARVLFDYGFYPTSALKAMDVLRRHPPLRSDFNNRLMIAEALERANLRGEALAEYVSLSKSENLTPEQTQRVHARIVELRQEMER